METENSKTETIENEQKAQIQNHEDHYQANIVEKGELYCVENKKFINEYEIQTLIGRGSFGKVKLAQRSFYDKEQNIKTQPYALKIFHKQTLEYYRLARTYKKDEDPVMMNQLDVLYEEINLYQYLDHQNICKLYQIIDDPELEKLYFVLEYCDLGQIAIWDVELQKYQRNEKIINFIINKYNIQADKYKQNELLEEIAKIIFFQVLQGVWYMHNAMKVVNRDIKPDNILCKGNLNNNSSDMGNHFSEIKIIDFSTARQLENEDELHFDCTGTPGIRGPEMQFASDGYNPKASDLWQVGMSIFCFLNEKLAWGGESNLEMDIAAKNKELVMEKDLFSPILQDLINKLCCKDWKNAISVEQALNHEWFQAFYPSNNQ